MQSMEFACHFHALFLTLLLYEYVSDPLFFSLQPATTSASRLRTAQLRLTNRTLFYLPPTTIYTHHMAIVKSNQIGHSFLGTLNKLWCSVSAERALLVNVRRAAEWCLPRLYRHVTIWDDSRIHLGLWYGLPSKTNGKCSRSPSSPSRIIQRGQPSI
ncbi:hypothetical protein LY76DRAFT_372356 [Colletotrichum caudatum]|nr:hypothetical protein LY76DRAFT_372356 [Colletotrichum caudatum]